eukprot:2381575-Amphidinium_carterae.1
MGGRDQLTSHHNQSTLHFCFAQGHSENSLQESEPCVQCKQREYLDRATAHVYFYNFNVHTDLQRDCTTKPSRNYQNSQAAEFYMTTLVFPMASPWYHKTVLNQTNCTEPNINSNEPL